MKIIIATVQIPFISGGAEILADSLRKELNKKGHQAEIVTIPFKWYPAQTLYNCMIMSRMTDLTEVNGEPVDLVIAMKFPAYLVKHPNKVIWLMHQHRQAYDLWNTPFGDMHNWGKAGEKLRQFIKFNDEQCLQEARSIFTIADNSTSRLEKYNAIKAKTLYPPPKNADKFHCSSFKNFVFYCSRIDSIKRQKVLVEAASHFKTDTKVYLAGTAEPEELYLLEKMISDYNLRDRVFLLGMISEEEKIDYYARCLGVYFGAYDEDYGYITLEAFLSKKPVIVHPDSGGPLEFVRNKENGFIVEPDPVKVAEAIDQWSLDPAHARYMGEQGHRLITEMNISWDYIIEQLTGTMREKT